MVDNKGGAWEENMSRWASNASKPKKLHILDFQDQLEPNYLFRKIKWSYLFKF